MSRRPTILSSTGVPLNNPDAPPIMGDANKATKIEDTISQADMADFDFVPVGHHMLGETIAPDSVTEGGIHTPYGTGDKPLYRILRLGQRSAHPNDFAQIHKGDVVFDRTRDVFIAYHTFPRLESGIDRKLAIMSLMAAEGIMRGYRWTDQGEDQDIPPLSAERPERKLNYDMRDFEPSYLEALRTKMMRPEDIEQLDIYPVSSNIIVENAPPQEAVGSIKIKDSYLPLYRVLRVPDDKTSFPIHLRFLEAGDLVMITILDRRNEVPHTVRNDAGDKRRIHMATVGSIVGWFPSYSWRYKAIADANEAAKQTEKAPDVIHVEESTSCGDGPKS